MPGEGPGPWHADWIESYLGARGIADDGARRSIASMVLAPPELEPYQVAARARYMATRHEPGCAAPPVVHVPEELPGAMPAQDLAPAWRSGGASAKVAAWRTLIHAWAGVIALLLTILDNAR